MSNISLINYYRHSVMRRPKKKNDKTLLLSVDIDGNQFLSEVTYVSQPVRMWRLLTFGHLITHEKVWMISCELLNYVTSKHLLYIFHLRLLYWVVIDLSPYIFLQNFTKKSYISRSDRARFRLTDQVQTFYKGTFPIWPLVTRQYIIIFN